MTKRRNRTSANLLKSLHRIAADDERIRQWKAQATLKRSEACRRWWARATDRGFVNKRLCTDATAPLEAEADASEETSDTSTSESEDEVAHEDDDDDLSEDEFSGKVISPEETQQQPRRGTRLRKPTWYDNFVLSSHIIFDDSSYSS